MPKYKRPSHGKDEEDYLLSLGDIPSSGSVLLAGALITSAYFVYKWFYPDKETDPDPIPDRSVAGTSFVRSPFAFPSASPRPDCQPGTGSLSKGSSLAPGAEPKSSYLAKPRRNTNNASQPTSNTPASTTRLDEKPPKNDSLIGTSRPSTSYKADIDIRPVSTMKPLAIRTPPTRTLPALLPPLPSSLPGTRHQPIDVELPAESRAQYQPIDVELAKLSLGPSPGAKPEIPEPVKPSRNAINISRPISNIPASTAQWHSEPSGDDPFIGRSRVFTPSETGSDALLASMMESPMIRTPPNLFFPSSYGVLHQSDPGEELFITDIEILDKLKKHKQELKSHIEKLDTIKQRLDRFQQRLDRLQQTFNTEKGATPSILSPPSPSFSSLLSSPSHRPINVGPLSKPVQSPNTDAKSETPDPMTPKQNAMDILESPSNTPTSTPRARRRNDFSIEASALTDHQGHQIDSPLKDTTSIFPLQASAPSSCVNQHHRSDNASWKLYQEVDYDLQKWLDRLQIPCSVRFPLDMSNVGTDGECGVCSRRPKRRLTKELEAIDGGKTVSASELKWEEMEERCKWTFCITQKSNPSDQKADYRKTWNHSALHDICSLPKVAKGDDLACDIKLVLKEQKARMENGELILLREWRKIAQQNPPPPRVILPQTYQLYDVETNEDPLTYSDSSSATSTDGTDFPEPSTEELALQRALLKKYPMDKGLAENEKALAEMRAETMPLREKRRKYDATLDLVQTTKRLVRMEGALKWKSRETIKEMNENDRIGALTTLEDESGSGMPVQQVIMEFLIYRCDREATGEMEAETGCGARIQKIVTGKDIEDKRNQRLRFPPYLRVLGHNPSPDSCSRVDFKARRLPWHRDLLPVLYAGECKPIIRQNKNTKAQLAAYFNATLILLILYYLDNRSSLDAPLPSWLYVYGIVYSEYGFSVYAHYPCYRTDEENGGWSFVSEFVTDAFKDIFRRDASDIDRFRALGALDRIKSQAYHLLDQLAQWENSKDVLAALEDHAVRQEIQPSDRT